MTSAQPQTAAFCADYALRLQQVLGTYDWSPVAVLGEELLRCWKDGNQVFICGNGGSAGNAVHLANDFLYGISRTLGSGLRVHALPANTAVLTCLANDEGYDQIYSLQLAVQARAGDVLIVLSGSGNSPGLDPLGSSAKVRKQVPRRIVQAGGELMASIQGSLRRGDYQKLLAQRLAIRRHSMVEGAEDRSPG